MNDRVLVVTPADDVQLKGFRICLINLDPDQSKIVSDILLNIRLDCTVIAYMWKSQDPTDWLFDKVYKSDLVIFNADIYDAIVGFLSANKKSYYFGNLKELSSINPRMIYAYDDCKEILNSFIEQYE